MSTPTVKPAPPSYKQQLERRNREIAAKKKADLAKRRSTLNSRNAQRAKATKDRHARTR